MPLASLVGVRHQIQPKLVVVLFIDYENDYVDLGLGYFASAGTDEEVGVEACFLGVDEGVADAEVEVYALEGEGADVCESVALGF